MDLPLTLHYDVVMFFSSDVAHQAQGSLAPDVCASVWSNQKSAPQQKHFAQRSDDTVPFSGHLVDSESDICHTLFFFLHVAFVYQLITNSLHLLIFFFLFFAKVMR